MSKRQILIIIGVWIMIFLFLGFPRTWDKIFALVCGALVIGISYRVGPKRERISGDVPYVEHRQEPAHAPTQETTDSIRG